MLTTSKNLLKQTLSLVFIKYGRKVWSFFYFLMQAVETNCHKYVRGGDRLSRKVEGRKDMSKQSQKKIVPQMTGLYLKWVIGAPSILVWPDWKMASSKTKTQFTPLIPSFALSLPAWSLHYFLCWFLFCLQLNVNSTCGGVMWYIKFSFIMNLIDSLG